MRRRIRRLAALGACLVVLVAVAAILVHWSRVKTNRRALEALEQVSNVLSAELLMEFPRKLRESSGVAVSVGNPGLFWTHNDSGHDAILYGVRPADGLVAEIRLTGARARDWEDISVGPCLRDTSKPCVYVGDVGNNFARRTRFALVVIDEPKFDAAGALPAETAWEHLELVYEEGARNAEGLAVSRAGDLLIVAKGGMVFGASRRDLVAGLEGAPVVLRADGSLPLPPEPLDFQAGRVTAATLQDDVLVVRTYHGVLFYRRTEEGWTSVRQPCWVGHLGPMGEGMDVARPDILYLTREKLLGFERPAALHRVVCSP